MDQAPVVATPPPTDAQVIAGTIFGIAQMFAYGVMYVLSFAIIITVFATAIALAVLFVMMACRSIWRLFR